MKNEYILVFKKKKFQGKKTLNWEMRNIVPYLLGPSNFGSVEQPTPPFILQLRS